jgi:hypothetical protein
VLAFADSDPGEVDSRVLLLCRCSVGAGLAITVYRTDHGCRGQDQDLRLLLEKRSVKAWYLAHVFVICRSNQLGKATMHTMF